MASIGIARPGGVRPASTKPTDGTGSPGGGTAPGSKANDYQVRPTPTKGSSKRPH